VLRPPRDILAANKSGEVGSHAKGKKILSVAILIGVHDGLVLATDSASTLLLSPPPGQAPQPAGIITGNVYDNANKIFNLVKGTPIGCATYGNGSIGSASIATLIKDLRKKLTAGEFGFDKEKYTIEQVCGTLGKFLEDECTRTRTPALIENTNIGFLVGGYSKGSPPLGNLGESWFVEISRGKAKDPVQLRKNEDVGLSWGGEGGEVVQRIVLGFSPRTSQVLAEIMQPTQTTAAIQQTVVPLLMARLQAPLVFAPMPIQDAIDLGRFLVQSAISFSRFLPGPQVVGGPIEIAAITKHEGFKWISRKYYFEANLNPEVNL
jgi:hypothetical protein